jgi:catechol 2,3-dioxygenase-like lactoylglutathione lyase family enzyme
VSVLDHIGFEVSDLERGARFYDAVFHAIGGRRLYADPDVVAWGLEVPQLWLTSRGQPAPGFGHVALRAPSPAHCAPPTPPAWRMAAPTPARRGPARSMGPTTTRPTCAIPMGSASRW